MLRVGIRPAAVVEDVEVPSALSKFKGLMHETLRPWQGPLILSLCTQVGPGTGWHTYCDMKPAALQRVISHRCQVEKKYREHHEALKWQVAQAVQWLTKVSGGTGAAGSHDGQRGWVASSCSLRCVGQPGDVSYQQHPH